MNLALCFSLMLLSHSSSKVSKKKKNLIEEFNEKCMINICIEGKKISAEDIRISHPPHNANE